MIFTETDKIGSKFTLKIRIVMVKKKSSLYICLTSIDKHNFTSKLKQMFSCTLCIPWVVEQAEFSTAVM